VFPKIGVPQNRWFIVGNPIKVDDLGVPLFSETSIYRSYFTPGKFHLESATSRRENFHPFIAGLRPHLVQVRCCRNLGSLVRIKRITWVSYTTHWLPLINRTWKTIGLQAFTIKNQREKCRFEQTPGASWDWNIHLLIYREFKCLMYVYIPYIRRYMGLP